MIIDVFLDIYWNMCWPFAIAAAFNAAIETPIIALAPNFDLFGVSSNSIIAWSKAV